MTKKIDASDEFNLPPHDTLPSIHVITPLVTIKNDNNGNLFIASSEDANCINSLVKLKKLLLKQNEQIDTSIKFKLTDDLICVRPSPLMMYTNNKTRVFCNKMITDVPFKLQLSCKKHNMITYDKPYSSVNLTWVIDAVYVSDTFDFSIVI